MREGIHDEVHDHLANPESTQREKSNDESGNKRCKHQRAPGVPEKSHKVRYIFQRPKLFFPRHQVTIPVASYCCHKLRRPTIILVRQYAIFRPIWQIPTYRGLITLPIEGKVP